MRSDPGAIINQISLRNGHPGEGLSHTSFSNDLCPRPLSDNKFKDLSFYVVRDDLLHPVLNGNKARKLDAVMPILQENSVTDVVTCGGCQSAHAAAVAVACSERGIRPHLLLRGEQPEISTGYNLISMLYGDITYIPRSEYAKRDEMLSMHASLVGGQDGSVIWLNDLFKKSIDDYDSAARFLEAKESTYTFSKVGQDLRKVVVISEGSGDVVGLLGVIRLVKCLSENYVIGKEEKVTIVLDAGTGTTAVGLAIGAVCLGLPWKVVAVMLAETIEGYKRREKVLISDFKRICEPKYQASALNGLDDGMVQWVDRIYPRRFGRVKKGEAEMCRHIARQTGILLDPIYTLAAWEHAVCLCRPEAEDRSNVIMLHTGGTLNMFGLAQRYKPHFQV
ncbi:unnamed protein product [Spirodela intermedia]|uniref:D-cysteine desulfhydrase n=1 Tax=Spirodela intermedia TaxID=51605 RepID=A0A7I8KE95_SPIIN|nr:unnamed protein product [Spirodela intermedia]